MADLAADDFLVLENGKPQRIVFVVPPDAVPLTVILLIDRSASMAMLASIRGQGTMRRTAHRGIDPFGVDIPFWPGAY